MDESSSTASSSGHPRKKPKQSRESTSSDNISSRTRSRTTPNRQPEPSSTTSSSTSGSENITGPASSTASLRHSSRAKKSRASSSVTASSATTSSSQATSTAASSTKRAKRNTSSHRATRKRNSASAGNLEPSTTETSTAPNVTSSNSSNQSETDHRARRARALERVRKARERSRRQSNNTHRPQDSQPPAMSDGRHPPMGFPMHLFGMGSPYMGGFSSSGDASLVEGLHSDDYGTKEHALDALNTKLLMESPQQFSRLPVSRLVQGLNKILTSHDENDLALGARVARVAASLLEALPQTAPEVIQLGPALVARFGFMEMDTCEAGLSCLKRLASEVPVEVLQLGVVPVISQTIDFFLGAAQKDAIALINAVAEVCDASNFDEYFKPALGNLSQFLAMYAVRDRKVVEATTLCFHKLARNLRSHPKMVEALAEHNLLPVLLQILQVHPPIVGGEGTTAILTTLALMAAASDNLARTLLENNVLSYLKSALLEVRVEGVEEPKPETAETMVLDEDENEGEDGTSEHPASEGVETSVEVTGSDHAPPGPRSAQTAAGGAQFTLSAPQLAQVAELVKNLLPRLPEDHAFEVFCREKMPPPPRVEWQWQCGPASWRPYPDSLAQRLEAQRSNGSVHPVRFDVASQSYYVDLHRMQQMNLHTRASRPVRRTVVETPPSPSGHVLREFYSKQGNVLSSMIVSLIGPLFDLYLSTARQDIHMPFAHAITRMLYAASDETLLESLKSVAMSSYLAEMLHSRDVVVTMSALASASWLLERLPDIFRLHFRRKGVFLRIEQLTKMRIDIVDTSPASSSSQGASSSRPSKRQLSVAKNFIYDYARTAFSAILQEMDHHSAEDPTVKRVAALAQELTSASVPFHEQRVSAALQELVTLCTDDSNSMTAFEFSHYGMARALSSYLTREDEFTTQRLQLFAKQLLLKDSTQAQALQQLLYLVHGALNVNEKFESTATAKQLDVRKITVKVSRAANEKELAAVHLNLAVPSTVAVQALYDYVWKEVERAERHPEGVPHHVRHLQELLRTMQQHRRSGDAPHDAHSMMSLGGVLEALHRHRTGTAVSSQEGQEAGSQRRRSLRHRLRHQREEPSSTPNSESNNGGQETTEGQAETTGSSGNNNNDSVGDDDNNTNSGRKKRSKGKATKKPTSKSSGGRRTRRGQSPPPEGEAEAESEAKAEAETPVARSTRRTARLTRQQRRQQEEQAKQEEEARKTTEAMRSAFADAERDLLSAMYGSNGDEDDDEDDVVADDDEEEEGEEGHPGDVVIVDEYAEEDDEDEDDYFQEEEEEEDDDEAEAMQMEAEYGDLMEEEEDEDEEPHLAEMERAVAQAINASSSDTGDARRRRGSNGSRREGHGNTMRVQLSASDDSWWKVISKGFRTRNKIELKLNGEVIPWNFSMIQAVLQLQPTASTPTESVSTGEDQAVPTNVSIEYCNASPRSRQISTRSLRGHSMMADSDSQSAHLDLPSSAKTIAREEGVADLLRILRVLHLLTSDGFRWLGSLAESVAVSPTAFINRRLAAKIMREVGNTQALIRGSFPSWVTEAIDCCPFLLSYEQRVRFFKYTAFGFALGLRYLTGDADEGDRQPISQTKVQVPREHLLATTAHIMQQYAAHPTELSVSFVGEVGSGLGPTLEYYARTCDQFQRADLNLWRDTRHAAAPVQEAKAAQTSKTTNPRPGHTGTSGSSSVEFVFNPQGLYPRPVAKLSDKSSAIFELLGAFMAKAIQDNRPLDLNFSPAFYRWLIGAEPCSLSDVRDVDEGLWMSLRKLQQVVDEKRAIEADSTLSEDRKAERLAHLNVDGCPIEDLCLDFTLPGYPEIQIGYAGSETAVTLGNLAEYIDAVVDYTLQRGVKDAMLSFTAGFCAVFNMASLQLFTVEEVRTVICGATTEKWQLHELRKCIKAEHGYDSNSQQVRHLIETLLEFDQDQRRKFIQFLTGSPNLPVGGFKALKPPFTVVLKDAEGQPPDNVLPSVMTCQNYFKLPMYSSKEMLKQRILVAITEGQGSFDLS
eukprot:m.175572 g.175572  ORF g.175572 m.175572 type:complete len:2014 (+) comp16549_c2_seq2:454-6495(+)